MKTAQYEIKNLHSFLQKCLGPNGDTVIEVTYEPLPLARQLFGSQLFSVEAVLESKDSKKNEILHLVAKMCPQDEFFKEAYEVKTTVKKELSFYRTILPTLLAFQREQDDYQIVDCVPKFYGGRISLDENSDTVDDDAVILLENLRFSGFTSIECENGLDLQKTMAALKSIAQFHAVAVALKISKPDVFREKILANLVPNKAFGGVSGSVEDCIVNSLTKLLELNDNCKKLVPRFLVAMKNGLRNLRNPKPPREPFATMIHNDYSVDNMLLMQTDEKEANEIKVIDFQVSEYGSPASDILCFIFTSARMELIESDFNNLLKYYYNNFISTLNRLNCDSSLFSFEQLKEEIDYYASHTNFFAIMILMKHVMCRREPAKPGKGFPASIVNDRYLEKLHRVILYFANRNWI